MLVISFNSRNDVCVCFPMTEVDVDMYPVHVLTSVLKTFFRDLPEPLLTFELYDEFIQASGGCTDIESISMIIT